MIGTGLPAPDFTLADSNGEQVTLSDYLGNWVVFWWYPEANSSGCSLQAVSLERNLDAIQADGTVVLGVSFNTVAQNDDFACDKDLRMPLLSDPEMQAGAAYGVIRNPDEPFPTKPRRHTFVIDPEGKIAFAEDANAIELAQYGEHIVEVLAGLHGDARE